MAFSLSPAGSSLNALERSQRTLERVTERLASGRRVNRATDDAAALALATELYSKGRVLGAARNNIHYGQAALRVADGNLGTQQELLSRARSLAVQSSNGVLSDPDRTALHAEFGNVIAEIDRIGNQTAFNGHDLLAGPAATDFTVRVGSTATAADGVGIEIQPSTADSLGGTDPTTGSAVSLHDLDIATAEGAATAMAILSDAAAQLVGNRAGVGASQNRLRHADRGAASSIINTEAARSGLVDLDIAEAATALSTAQHLRQAGIRALALQTTQRGKILDLLL